MAQNSWILTFGVLALAGSVVEVFYLKALEQSSEELIWALQKINYQWVVLGFRLLDVVTAGGFLATAFVIYWCGNKFKGAVAVLLGITGAILASFLKMCFSHPRPLYRFEDLHAYSCSKDPGFPSGHSLSSGSVAFFLLHHWTKHGDHIPHKVIFVLFCLTVVALDRLYLAAHFYFQIVMGFIYSLLLVSFAIKHETLHWLKQVMSQRKCQVYIHILGISFFISSFFIYYFRDPTVDSVWSENYLRKCGKEFKESEYLNKNLHETSAIGFIIGFCLGYSLTGKSEITGYSIRAVGIAVGLASLIGVAYIAIEFCFKIFLPDIIRVLASFCLRYLVGVLFAYFVPGVLNKWIEKEQLGYKLIGTSQANTKILCD